MNTTPSELRYTKSHEWARQEADGTLTVGISDHAQGLLGDIVFVELPEIDEEIASGAEAGVVESVKAASDIYSPVSGTVTAINEDLADSPQLVNTDPYGHGWLFRIQPEDENEFKELLSADDYTEQVVAEGH